MRVLVSEFTSVARADLIYTLNSGERYEERFRAPATVFSEAKVTAELPPGTTEYVVNLIDENNFLVAFPKLMPKGKKGGNAAKARVDE